MLPKKEKAQGLVEFALILPFLLLALLAVIETARLIWAYTTVQTAAREAARYAITGKPYVASANYVPDLSNNYCAKPDGEPGATTPWNCNSDQLVTYRLQAIREMAKRRLSTMPLKESTCSTDELYTFHDPSPADCTRIPGTYGILVVGQQISSTVSVTTPVPLKEYPGTQGLNVRVAVFYNVEMFDPIMDAIVDAMNPTAPSGGYIQVSGQLEMQNEGVDPSLGSVPPPAIGSSALYTNNSSDQIGPNGEQIWSKSGDTVYQNEFLTVHLENHLSQGGPYDIYLGSYKICSNKNTNTQNNGDYDCLIDSSIPPGLYDLFSTRLDQYPNRLVTAAQKVEVKLNATPSIVIKNGNVWSARSNIQIQLVSHDPAPTRQPYKIYFNYGLPSQQLIATVNATDTVPIWQVPNVGNLCPVGSATPCKIESRSNSDGYATTYASTDIFINPPQITLAGNPLEIVQGETIYIGLTGHTPNTKYDIQIKDFNGNTYYIGRTAQPTNSLGDTVIEIPWTVFEPGAIQPWTTNGWPNGISEITSYEATSATPNITPSNWIALKQIEIKTPTGPYISVDMGYTWPINSIITIKVHNHTTTGNPYFLNFGSFRVPVVGANPADTFSVGTSGSAAQNYTIPPAAATNGQQPTVQTIASYKNSAPSTIVAQHDITVTTVPIIKVLEGDRALPDATITISLTNHLPNSIYQIAYAGVTLLDDSNQPFTIHTDPSGKGQRTYSLLTLPPGHPAASPANYGIAYVLNSQLAIAPATVVATTTLMIDSADLKITQIQLPATAPINTSVSMAVTVQNTKPVTISRYFDVDLYDNPSPMVPAYHANQFNFPGDVKLWKAPIVAPYGKPGDTFTMTQAFTLTTYGTHVFYGYADTSNFIFNETDEVNNILSNTVTVNCNYSFITDTFANLNAFTTKIYNTTNTANASSYPRVNSNHLFMRNDGQSTSGADDNASSRGHVLLYRTQSITSEAGLDVRVQVFTVPTTANFAKAGLQLRVDPASGTSPKIEFGLAWDSSTSRYRIQYNYRTAAGTLAGNSPAGTINLSTNPVWIRIKRNPASDSFTFYYVQQSATPNDAQWLAFETVTIPISSTLYAGLFNASYVDNTNGTAEFANFSVSNTATCPAAQGPATPANPPGFTVCTDPLLNKSFETVSNWVLAGSQFVSYGPGGHTGTRQLLAHSFNGGYKTPNFYQQFTFPASLLATTTLKLDFWYNLNNMGDGDDANDKYYAVVSTSPSPSVGLLTNPTEILNGDIAPSTTSAPINTSTGWTEKTVTLSLANGVNLNSYLGQNLYLYIYNNSNVGCTPGVNCHASEFYFDDVSLNVCTGEPEPASPTTTLTGVVWLHQSGASPRKISGVTVWAYAENGQLYKTFTIQDGKFNFFNLPSGSYFLYAEYFITDPNDPTQIQQLAADITVDLNTTVNTRLDLFPVN